MTREAGFTLLEVLLSLGILALMAGMSLPIYNSFIASNDVENTTNTIAGMLRRAETYARANSGDSQWGVNFQAATVTVFQGTSYGTRNSGLDETLNVPGDISLSYSGDVVFAKLTGVPSATPTITVSNAGTNSNQTVAINAKGMVSD